MADDVVFEPARDKTEEEIAYAREATRIAEAGYERLLQIVKPGMSEDELAVEVAGTPSPSARKTISCCCAEARIIARCSPLPDGGWPSGDIIVIEITPSYRGQLAQICRTIVLGPPCDMLTENMPWSSRR